MCSALTELRDLVAGEIELPKGREHLQPVSRRNIIVVEVKHLELTQGAQVLDPDQLIRIKVELLESRAAVETLDPLDRRLADPQPLELLAALQSHQRGDCRVPDDTWRRGDGCMIVSGKLGIGGW